MLDRTTLSASQRPLTRSSKDSLRDTEKIPIIVPDLSASVGNLRPSSSGLPQTTPEGMEIASSIELTRMYATTYPSWQERDATSFFLFIGHLRLLEQRYTFRERDELVQVLEKYPPFSLLFLEIHRQIQPYFPCAQFFLQAIMDPESDDEPGAPDDRETIVVSVVTRMQPREALEGLKEFYKDWWLTTLVRSKMKEKISFNLECV
jgi:hypothetical protein